MIINRISGTINHTTPVYEPSIIEGRIDRRIGSNGLSLQMNNNCLQRLQARLDVINRKVNSFLVNGKLLSMLPDLFCLYNSQLDGVTRSLRMCVYEFIRMQSFLPYSIVHWSKLIRNWAQVLDSTESLTSVWTFCYFLVWISASLISAEKFVTINVAISRDRNVIFVSFETNVKKHFRLEDIARTRCNFALNFQRGNCATISHNFHLTRIMISWNIFRNRSLLTKYWRENEFEVDVAKIDACMFVILCYVSIVTRIIAKRAVRNDEILSIPGIFPAFSFRFAWSRR